MSGPSILASPTRTFVALRLVMAMAICAMSLQSLPTSGWLVRVLLGAYLLSNAAPFFKATAAFIRRLPAPVLFALDVGIIVLVMLLTGEVRSEFYVVFFLIILMAAMAQSARTVFAIAFVSALLYALLTGTTGFEALLSTEFTTRIALFFVTALFSGYLAEQVSTERERHHHFRSFYRTLFEESAHGILIAREDGTVLDANPPARFLLGKEPVGETIGRLLCLRTDPIAETLSPLPSADREETMRKADAVFQVEFPREGGGPRACEVTFRRFSVSGAGYLLASLQDVEAIRRMRDRILHLEKSSLLGNFVKSITHEINNPLTAVLGHAELILAQEPSAPLSESARAILEAGLRCKKVVESMLGQFRHKSLALRPVRLSECLRSVAKLMEFHLRYHLVKITIDLDDSILVSADAQQLEQVFTNLMCNSVHAMRERPVRVLGLRSYASKHHAVVEVSDTGMGIPPDVLRHLFEPGFTTKPAGEGHGLGLTICREMINRHGGEIKVASRRGEGTVFTILLPRAAAEATAPATGLPGP